MTWGIPVEPSRVKGFIRKGEAYLLLELKKSTNILFISRKRKEMDVPRMACPDAKLSCFQYLQTGMSWS